MLPVAVTKSKVDLYKSKALFLDIPNDADISLTLELTLINAADINVINPKNRTNGLIAEARLLAKLPTKLDKPCDIDPVF